MKSIKDTFNTLSAAAWKYDVVPVVAMALAEIYIGPGASRATTFAATVAAGHAADATIGKAHNEDACKRTGSYAGIATYFLVLAATASPLLAFCVGLPATIAGLIVGNEIDDRRNKPVTAPAPTPKQP